MIRRRALLASSLALCFLAAACAPPASVISRNADYKRLVASALNYDAKAALHRRYYVSPPLLGVGVDFSVCVTPEVPDGRGGWVKSANNYTLITFVDGRITNVAEHAACDFRATGEPLEPLNPSP
jgi:hypothetical protein